MSSRFHSSSSSSLSLQTKSYALVRLSNKRNSSQKKVLIEKSLTRFKQSIQRAFNKNSQLFALKNENGEAITDIRDVTPGMKIIAVFKSYKNLDSQSQVSLKSEADSIQSYAAKPPTIYNEVSLNDSASIKSDISFRAGAKSLFGVSPSKSIKVSRRIFDENQNQNNNNSEIQKEDEPEAEANENNANENFDQNLSSSYSSDNQADILEENENEEEGKLEELEQEPEEEEIPEEEEEVEEDIQTYEKLIKSCISIENENKSDIENAYLKLIPESKQMLDDIFSLEDKQKINFYQEMTKILDEQGLKPKMDSLIFTDLLIKKAKNFISEHRISNPIASSYVFHSVVMGPPKSGKSTYLGIIAQQFLIDLMVTNNWKKTFVFVADLDRIMSGFQDNRTFYHLFINHLFNLLKAQLPSMAQYLPKIEKSFHSITDMPTQINSFPLPVRLAQNLELKKLSADLQSIGASLASIWFDPTALSQWITSLVMLPSLLAKTFGFQNVVYILDHFEACTVQIDPLYPFEDSRPILYVNEYWKYAINNNPYILSTGDETSLIDDLGPSDEEGVDLLLDIEFISIFDIVEAFDYSDVELTIDFEDENMIPLKLTGNSCAGVPIYVNQWIKLNEIIDNMEKVEEGTEEEVLCQMISEAETLLFLLILREFGDPNDSIEDQKFGVSAVHRRTQKE